MSTFTPFEGYVEIELLHDESPLARDEKTNNEKGKIISSGSMFLGLKEGDIIFFRPHGCFETVEHEGVTHHVVRIDKEFILGYVRE